MAGVKVSLQYNRRRRKRNDIQALIVYTTLIQTELSIENEKEMRKFVGGIFSNIYFYFKHQKDEMENFSHFHRTKLEKK